MTCDGCGAEVMLGSAHCGNCGRSILGGDTPTAAEATATAPIEALIGFDAPPPPPVGWTIEDGPARAALLPPPPASAKGGLGPTPPKNKGGCGCGAAVGVLVLAVVAGIVAVIASAVSGLGLGGGRVDAPALALEEPIGFDLESNDTAVHPLTLGEGAVTITVEGGFGFDPVLDVFAADGTLLGHNDDADGVDSRLSFTLVEGGELRVEVSEFSGDPGSYEVLVASGAVGTPIDPGDVLVGERVEAEALETGIPVQRFLGAGDTAVHILPGFEGRVTITVVGADDFDPVLEVRAPDGSVVGRNDDFDGRNSLLTFQLSSSDALDVEVTEFSGDAGIYSVLVQRGDPDAPQPPIDGGHLLFGSPEEGTVGLNQAAEYQFVGDGREVTFTVEGLDGFDPFLRVLAANGDELARNDDADGLNSRIDIEIAGAATVIVEVTGFNGEPGRYRVSVQ